MITEEEKLIIKETDNKLALKRIFNDLSSSMIEYYDLNHLTKKELKNDIQSAWLETMIRAREIDEKTIKDDCLNERNEKLNNNQNPNPNCSDPADKEKILALEKEIKELNETLNIYEQKILKAKSENMKIKLENLELTENATTGKDSHNARGAGRKQKITDEQIKEIQEMRSQGIKLQEIQDKTGISYGNIQKYCKLITDNNKKRAGS